MITFQILDADMESIVDLAIYRKTSYVCNWVYNTSSKEVGFLFQCHGKPTEWDLPEDMREEVWLAIKLGYKVWLNACHSSFCVNELSNKFIIHTKLPVEGRPKYIQEYELLVFQEHKG